MSETTSGRSFYTNVALLGLLIYFVAAAITFVAALLLDPAESFFILFFIVPGLIVGAALLFIRKWGLIIAILLGIFLIFSLTSDAGLFLTTPAAFFDFSSMLFGVVGLLIVVIASIVGLIQFFTGNPRTTGTSTEIQVLRGIVGVLAVVAGISLVLTILNIGGVSEAEEQGVTTLTAKKVDWDNEMIDAPGGQPLRLVVKNDDPILHTFTIYELDIDTVIGPWAEEVIEITPTRSGVFAFVCRVTGHVEDMTGGINFR
jgi:hypothetical protein